MCAMGPNLALAYFLISLTTISAHTNSCSYTNEFIHFAFKTNVSCSNLTLDTRSSFEEQISYLDLNKHDIREIVITSSNIPIIDSKLFYNCSDCSELEFLFLNGNNIAEIKANSFSRPKKLREINLSHNKLTKIEKNTLNDLVFLKKLDLSYNMLNDISTFDLPTNLEQLDISNNNLSNIETNFLLQPNLTTLNLSSNHLPFLPSLNSCVNLIKLDVSNNKAMIFKKIFQNLTKLKELNLSYNNLHDINYIRHLNTLENLNLSHCISPSPLSHNPPTQTNFENMKSLRVLDLSHNSLANLEPNLFINSPNLTELFLSHNNLLTFPSNLFYKNIMYLDVKKNRLGKMNCEQIQGAVDLRWNFMDTVCHFGVNTTRIDFSENDLTLVKNGSFKQLKNLIYLNLTRNFILTVEPNAFENLNNLEILTINDNFISVLHVGMFSHMHHLKTLNLSWNKLENITIGIFTGLSSLQDLDLSHNNIEFINIHVFINLIKLEKLYLNSNPIISFDYQNLDFLPDLRVISVNYIKIGCHSLFHTIKHFQNSNIGIVPGNVSKESNINGIPCDPDEVDEELFSEQTTLQKLRRYVISAFTSIILILVLFFVLFTSYLISWCSNQFNSNVIYMKKDGKSCSLTLLSENNED